MVRRTRDEQRPIAIGDVARIISTDLIARYGILQALDVAERVYEQVRASLESQKRLHPEDWTDKPVQTIQPEAENMKNTRKIPPIVT